MYHFLLACMIINNLIFNFWNHPLNLMICLFIKTLIICLIMCLMNNFSWFSYILFLVFIGGMLILLMYSISLVGNMKYFKNENMLMQLFLILLGVGILFYINIYFDFFWQSQIFQIQNIEKMFLMNKLFLFPGVILNVFLICYLFMLLIVVTKITLTLFGPLRICKYFTHKK